APRLSGFCYHEVAWESGSGGRDRVYDACLMIDADHDPAMAPYRWRLPTAMLVGDCRTMHYRVRISPPGASGCANCQPHTEHLRRRRICQRECGTGALKESLMNPDVVLIEEWVAATTLGRHILNLACDMTTIHLPGWCLVKVVPMQHSYGIKDDLFL